MSMVKQSFCKITNSSLVIMFQLGNGLALIASRNAADGADSYKPKATKSEKASARHLFVLAMSHHTQKACGRPPSTFCAWAGTHNPLLRGHVLGNLQSAVFAANYTGCDEV